MMRTSKVKTQQEIEEQIMKKTIQFFKTVEAGDLALFNIIDEAIAMFGFTKVGKTTSSHMICQSSLRGQKKNGELIFKAASNRFLTAKIGQNPQSQTQIPNIFEVLIKLPKENGSNQIRTKKVFLMDQPGYGDTYGFHRIYSNGYFHYRTFSKTPKLKFILAFKKDDLTGTGEYFKRTITNFINTFNNWEEIKDKIVKATSFLITKADVGTKFQNLKGMVENLREVVGTLSPSQIEKYQLIIDQVLMSDRLFFIEKPKNVFDTKMDDKIIQNIYDRSEFWERPVVGSTVDMKYINFSVQKQISAKLRDPNEQLFKLQFESFMKYMDERIMNIMKNDPSSLIKTIETLKKDAVESSDSNELLTNMKQFINTFYHFRQDYRLKRQSIEVNLFKEREQGKWILNTNEQLEKEMRIDYFLKKFSVLQYLKDLNMKLEEVFEKQIQQAKNRTSRSIEELEQFSEIFIGIFRKLGILRENPVDKTIYKYSYIIQRLIQEYKIMTLILFSNQTFINNLMVSSIYQPKNDLFMMFRDQFLGFTVGTLDVSSLKEEFISKVNFSTLNITEQTIKFFENIVNKSAEVSLKIAKIIIKYSEKLYENDRIPTDKEITFIGKKLHTYRNNFYSYFSTQNDQGLLNQDSKEQLIEIIIQLTNRLAFILSKKKSYSQARQCFKSICNAESVLNMHELQINENFKDKMQTKNRFQAYAKDAQIYHRKELALKCYQQAFALTTTFKEKKDISQLIVSLCTQTKITEQNGEQNQSYLKSLENGNFCSDFSDDLRERIEFALE